MVWLGRVGHPDFECEFAKRSSVARHRARGPDAGGRAGPGPGSRAVIRVSGTGTVKVTMTITVTVSSVSAKWRVHIYAKYAPGSTQTLEYSAYLMHIEANLNTTSLRESIVAYFLHILHFVHICTCFAYYLHVSAYFLHTFYAGSYFAHTVL